MEGRNQGAVITTGAVLTITIVCVGIIAFFLFGIPRYKVWQQEMKGRAELAQAEQNRQIKIEEAKANLEAEKLNAQAEVVRAQGAAEAIKIENDYNSLKMTVDGLSTNIAAIKEKLGMT